MSLHSLYIFKILLFSNTKMKKFVAIGHVDTGKSCLCGHLLYKCGYIDDHSMNKIKDKAEKEKMGRWFWSRVLDIYEDEMRRGKTHEFNQIEFDYQEKKYQLIDTPGHQTYVRSMIEGISQDVNICMLLISMIPNEFESSFEKGMLKEHLILARSLDIRFIILVGNKMDAIGWDENIYNESINKIKKYLKSINWREKCIRDIPISAFEGVGLVDNKDMPSWYKSEHGNNLLEIIDNIPFPKNQLSIVLENCIPTDTFIVEIRIFNLEDDIISSGFTFNCHFQGEEAEIKVVKLKQDLESKNYKVFAKKGEKVVALVKSDKKIKIAQDLKMIFRKNNYTLGFGKVLKVKT